MTGIPWIGVRCSGPALAAHGRAWAERQGRGCAGLAWADPWLEVGADVPSADDGGSTPPPLCTPASATLCSARADHGALAVASDTGVPLVCGPAWRAGGRLFFVRPSGGGKVQPRTVHRRWPTPRTLHPAHTVRPTPSLRPWRSAAPATRWATAWPRSWTCSTMFNRRVLFSGARWGWGQPAGTGWPWGSAHAEAAELWPPGCTRRPIATATPVISRTSLSATRTPARPPCTFIVCLFLCGWDVEAKAHV